MVLQEFLANHSEQDIPSDPDGNPDIARIVQLMLFSKSSDVTKSKAAEAAQPMPSIAEGAATAEA